MALHAPDHRSTARETRSTETAASIVAAALHLRRDRASGVVGVGADAAKVGPRFVEAQE